ncbi:MAG: acetyl-coenzyme synthetase, partial [Arthrobacter sp.]|nr:acetyl-coenzyme synthetase [Arthrobacter sp.]
MTPDISSALSSPARISPSESRTSGDPKTTSNATAIEAGLRDAPGSLRGSSGWSSTEPPDGTVHGVPKGGPARHSSSSTTPASGPAAGTHADGITDAHAVAGAADTVAFWEQQALRLDWAPSATPGGKPWHTAHRKVPADAEAGTGPDITWFEGGRLNVAYNCVDRHVAAGRGDKVALHFEGEPGDRRSITYAELQREVSKAANALLALGITKGDRVVIYLPVIPETVI